MRSVLFLALVGCLMALTYGSPLKVAKREIQYDPPAANDVGDMDWNMDEFNDKDSEESDEEFTDDDSDEDFSSEEDDLDNLLLDENTRKIVEEEIKEEIEELEVELDELEQEDEWEEEVEEQMEEMQEEAKYEDLEQEETAALDQKPESLLDKLLETRQK